MIEATMEPSQRVKPDYRELARVEHGKYRERSEKALCFKVYKYLKCHIGRDNAITCRDIAMAIDCRLPSSEKRIQECAADLLFLYCKPVISCGAGMFLAETHEEIEEYKNEERNRAIKILMRLRAVDYIDPEPPQITEGLFPPPEPTRWNGEERKYE